MNLKIRQRHRGVATVELAVVLPVLVILFLGMCEVGRAINGTILLQNAAAVGGRQASVGQATNAQVKQSVLNYLSAAGVPTTNVTVTINDLTASGIDVSQASTLDKLQVIVTVPFKDIKWGVAGFVVPNTSTVTGTATYYSARVNPYPTNIQVPAGS